ncbi:hypothetical protein OG905_11215 [Streptomyces sp. NBC_00322]|uniref:hypothetical protein n=1 Tax=Streptomyces sp. NBC_00322 TaxID=2975712 RepID=UPI002E2C4378|nr:hypothetical protein [Streptomyces sp. NBC_00322]
MSVEGAYSLWVEIVRPVAKNAFQKLAGDALSRYELITNGGDRHGALEWVFYSQTTADDPMDRLAAIAVIPHPQAGSADFEFWFGGRLGDLYVRRLSSCLSIEHQNMNWGVITDALRDAALQANSMTEQDLITKIPERSLW